jgi:hypothetical protein
MGKGKVAALVTSAVMLVGAGSASAQVLPVGSWNFNEGSGTVAHDSSFSRDNGALQGNASWTQGRFWDGLSFGGGSDAVDVQNGSQLQPANLTVSAWVKASASPGKYRYIVAKGSNVCSAGSYGLYTSTSGGLQFYVSSNDGLTYAASPDAGTAIWDGKWHNVIGTFDGSTVRLYVDGREVGSGTPDTSPISYGLPTSNDLMVGNYTGCSSYPLGFNGSIDQVRIFDRALGAQEIRLTVGTSQLLPPVFPEDLVL